MPWGMRLSDEAAEILRRREALAQNKDPKPKGETIRGHGTIGKILRWLSPAVRESYQNDLDRARSIEDRGYAESTDLRDHGQEKEIREIDNSAAEQRIRTQAAEQRRTEAEGYDRGAPERSLERSRLVLQGFNPLQISQEQLRTMSPELAEASPGGVRDAGAEANLLQARASRANGPKPLGQEIQEEITKKLSLRAAMEQADRYRPSALFDLQQSYAAAQPRDAMGNPLLLTDETGGKVDPRRQAVDVMLSRLQGDPREGALFAGDAQGARDIGSAIVQLAGGDPEVMGSLLSMHESGLIDLGPYADDLVEHQRIEVARRRGQRSPQDPGLLR